jgi:uncharacterized protein YbgA (DUF1722 family)/uncharacterized protein YbbK (DUF523 family)
MTDFPKPKIVVSKCLGFEACRFNGEIIRDSFVSRLGAFVDYQTVCPEVEIGLGTPRPTIRLVESAQGLRLIQPSTGADLSDSMRRFCAGFLDSLKEVDGFVLTHKSPSCGIGDAKFYGSVEKGPALGKMSGFFAEAVLRRFPHLAVEDDGRLLNLRIREHFLTRIFAFARLRALRRSVSMRALVQFHAAHKFILLSYNERKMRQLGKLVANPGRENPRKVAEAYAATFHEALGQLPKITPQVNVLMHALGFFSKQLSSREKKHFLEALDSYRAGRVPLLAVSNVLWSWALRFETAYLLEQAYFRPFPEGLLAIENSGKGRPVGEKSRTSQLH